MTAASLHVGLAHLAHGLDAPVPDELYVGKGTVLPLRGWCYSQEAALGSLSIVVGNAVTPIFNHSWGRTDVFSEQCPAHDRSGNSLLSGFECALSFPEATADREEEVTLRATLTTGQTIERLLGRIWLRAGYGPMPTVVNWPGEGPRVAICMATFEPPATLFFAQIASLQAQTHTNWVCIISDDNTSNEHWDRVRLAVRDDPRFYLFQSRTRLNFYDNFQNALRLAPADADFIALCDQDDVWRPHKIETLLAAFRGNDQLVFSDARVVDEGGSVLSETFWSTRENNYTDLPSLMVANTITGAASLFRASLRPDVLPFPKQVGPAFHDHWIGLVGLLKGGIGYVDRPLYDYVQHTTGVIGHNHYKGTGVLSALATLLRAFRRPREVTTVAAQLLKRAADDHIFVTQKVVLARTLLLRNSNLPPEQRAALERFTRFDTSLRAALDEKIAAMIARRHTLNREGLLLWSMIGTRLRNLALRRKQGDLLRQQINNPGLPLLGTVARAARLFHPAVPPAPIDPADPGIVPVLEYGATKWIHRNITPLTVDVSERYSKRVNLLLATINFNYIFGGYIGMFNIALRLRREGYRPRIILLENTEWDLENWRTKIQKYPGLTTLFEEVEVISRWDRTIPVESNPDDRFVATNCWAAHVSHHTAKMLNEKRFLFMVQEYEPFFMAMNSISALFQEAYTFPQLMLFSTELLQDFFRRERIGVFAKPGSERDALVFSNAIQTFCPTRDQLTRTRRRLLFYSRQEEHASRNLFELGMMALAALVQDPRVDLSDWSFHGIGSMGGNMLELKPGLPFELEPKTSLQEYIRKMADYDVGLALMLTPHPSLVPIEMASAGMWTVTNTLANKTSERLRDISTNLIGVQPTVGAIVDGLVEAMTRVDQIDERLAGAKVNWPDSWDEAFPAETLARIRAFLGTPE
jgi:glycosyltransferase involved in cell wall biosynthesis